MAAPELEFAAHIVFYSPCNTRYLEDDSGLRPDRSLARFPGGAMKTAGIIGGIGPESTIEYYRFLVEEYRSRVRDDSYPRIVINSVNLTRLLHLVGAGELRIMADYLAGEIRKLARAGADFGALASNTPHIVFDELRRRAPIPLLSIVEATCEAALALKLGRVGLFGTKFTMQGNFYPEVFVKHGIAVVAPEPVDQDVIHERYLGELVKGILRPETCERLLEIATRMRDRQQIDGVILGGTELPLILRDAAVPGVPFLDTTRIHVGKIVAAML